MNISPGAWWSRIRQLLVHGLLGDPLPGSRGILSEVHPVEGEGPSARLIDLSLRAIEAARTEDLSEISLRIESGPRWPDRWPGEHYQLLSALMRVLQPRVAIEIGTFQGLGSLAILHGLPEGGVLHTFDVIPFADIPGSVLKPADFSSGRLIQVLDDVTRPEGLERHRGLLASADFLFIDALKDGQMEYRLLHHLEGLAFHRPPIVMWDDIRFWNMLRLWRMIDRPKLDLTSFGHFSGTGLVDWSPSVRRGS